MAYIGRDIDKISNVEVLDNITFDGSSSYTLQKGGSNFTPSSANTLLVSIDGVVQAGNFTVSGSTINFGTAVSASSTCNFILHYGVGLITAPADGTVTTAKLANTSVTPAKMDLSQNYTFTGAVSGHNYPAFEAYISSVQTITDNVMTKAQFDTEILDTDGCYDNVTNYRFTPTVAGKYFVYANVMGRAGGVNLQYYLLDIYKNGVAVRRTQIDSTGNEIDNINILNNIILDFNGSTDYVEVFAQINDTSGSPEIFAGNKSSLFGAYRIGA